MKDKTRSNTRVNGAVVTYHVDDEVADLRAFAKTYSVKCKACLLPEPILQAMNVVRAEGLLGVNNLAKWLREKHKANITYHQLKHHFTHTPKEA